MRPVFRGYQGKAGEQFVFAVEAELEPVVEKLLEHDEEVMLGCGLGTVGFGLDAEPVIAGPDPVGAALDLRHDYAICDTDEVAEAAVDDDAAAEGRHDFGGVEFRIDAVAAAADTVQAGGARADGGDLKDRGLSGEGDGGQEGG